MACETLCIFVWPTAPDVSDVALEVFQPRGKATPQPMLLLVRSFKLPATQGLQNLTASP